eukprot:UN09994
MLAISTEYSYLFQVRSIRHANLQCLFCILHYRHAILQLLDYTLELAVLLVFKVI